VRATRLHAPLPPTQVKTASNDRPRCLENSRRAVAEFRSLPKTATFHFRLNQDTTASPSHSAYSVTRNLPISIGVHIALGCYIGL
jgi:hypothetical protein